MNVYNVNTDGCSQTCKYTNGGFICEYNCGYLLKNAGSTCNGIYAQEFAQCCPIYVYR